VLPGKTYSPEEIAQILRKRWWLALLPFTIGTMLGVFLYQSTPERYRSETLIMVVPQRVPDSYIKPTVTGTVEDRLASINDQILSRSRLERIITDFDLYREARAAGAIMQDVVETMRDDIDVEPPGDGLQTFKVAFKASDAPTARKVTERLASLYIEENLRERESLAENTSLFLENQLEEARRRLIAQEEKLEAYRNRHSGTMPEQVSSNMQAISQFQIQLKEVNGAIGHGRERRLMLERQLADAETPLPTTLSTIPADPTQRQTFAAQLEAAKAQLEILKQRYKPEHPDIKSGERLIRDLQIKADEEARQAKLNPLKASPAELARQRTIRDLKDQISDIDRQTAGWNVEAAGLRARISEYQSRIDAVPARESELVELTRDYETLKLTYTSLLAKKEDSKLAANLERGQIGEQFRILDPATMPARPYNQKNRLTMGISASLGGLVLGLLMISGLEYRDSSFKTEEDVMRVLSLPVLALVPMLGEAGTRPPRKKWRSALGFSAFFLVVACAAALAVWNR
jgi:polysaccharide chain length determinant protein (PEP-CTERM system associated)